MIRKLNSICYKREKNLERLVGSSIGEGKRDLGFVDARVVEGEDLLAGGEERSVAVEGGRVIGRRVPHFV